MIEASKPVADSLILALDTGSPRVSLALGREGNLLLKKDFPQSSASEHLLVGVAAGLAELGAVATDLGGLVALAGPGSFTGLRVGLATALGLHQALGIPAMAVPSFLALAETVERSAKDQRVVAIVDALRGEWFAQEFAAGSEPPLAVGEPRFLDREGLLALAPALVVGFGAEQVLGGAAAPAGLTLREPPPLAAACLAIAARWSEPWEVRTLVNPLYLRPPAVTIPVPRPA